MALSDDATLLAYVRSMLPNTVVGDEYHVTDAMLDYYYANKLDANGNNSSADVTIAWALRQMCTKLSSKVTRTNTATGDTVAANQEREAVCASATQWANLAGINTGQIGTVTTGSINLGIDEEDSEFNIT